MQIERTLESSTPGSAGTLQLLRLQTASLIILVGLASSAGAAWIESPAASGKATAASSMGGMSAKGACSTTSKDVARRNSLLREGRYVEARAVLLAALDDPRRRSAGPEDLACLLNLVAYVELQEQRPQLAVDLIRRALAAPSVPEPVVAMLTSNLAGAYLDLSQLDSAERFARQAVSLSESAFGSGHPETQFAQARLAVVHVRRGEYARAEPVLRRILQDSEQTWGESSYEAARAAGNLAMVHSSSTSTDSHACFFRNRLQDCKQIQFEPVTRLRSRRQHLRRPARAKVVNAIPACGWNEHWHLQRKTWIRSTLHCP